MCSTIFSGSSIFVVVEPSRQVVMDEPVFDLLPYRPGALVRESGPVDDRRPMGDDVPILLSTWLTEAASAIESATSVRLRDQSLG